MKSAQIQRVKVWPGWLRAAHWLIALPVLVLMVTGWILSSGMYVGRAASDFHFIAAWVLIVGLALRVSRMVVGVGPERIGALIPSKRSLSAMAEMLRFYLRFGRGPLPRWYAHNPFWGPWYLLLLALLVFQTVSGLMMMQGFGDPSAEMGAWHIVAARWIVLLSVLHVVAVVIHDLRGLGCDVSAMIHGHRVFEVPAVDVDNQPDQRPRQGEIPVRIQRP